MSIFIPQVDMTAYQIIQCCVRARAIISLCEEAAWAVQNSDGADIPQIAENIQFALKAAHELLGPVQDAIEVHEGTAGGDA